MPLRFKRKRIATRRPAMRPARRMARLPRVRPRYQKPRNTIHYATFRIQDPTAEANVYNSVDSAGTPESVFNHIAWSLDQFPQASCFVRMYNQYRISKIKVEFIPVNTRAQIGGANVGVNSNVPTFGCYVNRTSTNFPTTLNQILSVPGAKQINAGRYVKQYFSPVTFDSVYRAGALATNALNPEYNQWIRTVEADVKHHGVSWVMSQAGSAWASQAFRYRTVVTIYAQFKGIKVDSTLL